MAFNKDTGLEASSLSHHWRLEPGLRFLNHGSFGACPTQVLEAQARWRERMETQPLTFLGREFFALMGDVRAGLGEFLGADPEGLALVPNATTGVNTVLRSLSLEPGDELLVTNQEYNACRNALDYIAAKSGATVVVVEIPFPLEDASIVTERLVAAVTGRTSLLLIDHVTSPTGLILPLEEIVPAMQSRGVDVLVDGAHSPGMLPLDLQTLGAAYYTGNCHKWLCAPKGAAFLHVREDRRDGIHPLTISHGWNAPRDGSSLFRLLFDWTGTVDPTPWLCIPEAIRFLGDLLPGGWPEVLHRNRGLALAGREILCEALRCPPPCPESMIGSMAAVPLPNPAGLDLHPVDRDPLQAALMDRYRIEIPVIHPGRIIRISAQLYNHAEEYVQLAAALRELLEEEGWS